MTAHHVGNLAPPEPSAVMPAENPDGSLLHFIVGFAAIIFLRISMYLNKNSNE